MSKGYVYLLSNPAMPGLYKIGKTTRDPNVRAKDLHQTGTPLPFKVEHAVLVPNCDELEFTLHQTFGSERVSPDREFFRVNLAEVISEMDDWQIVQVSRLVEEYLPEHEVVNPDLCVAEGPLADLAHSLGEPEILVADALRALEPEEVRPAIKRVQERVQKRLAERKRAKNLAVVSNG